MSPRARVLLVDDNADQLDNLREILTDEDYEVLTAQTCAAARAEAAAGYDVALVDLRLPDGDGTVLAQELRRAHPGEVFLRLDVSMHRGGERLARAQLLVRAQHCHRPQGKTETFHAMIFFRLANVCARAVCSCVDWRRKFRSGSCSAIAWSSAALAPF